MKVLIGCEFSGIVRSAFAAKGHQACSVDLLPTEIPGNHVIADVRDMLNLGWDMMIAFPPCTYLARSGAQWHWGSELQEKAIWFFIELMNAPIPRIAIENPVGIINSLIDKPTQIIEPWMFGHGETKKTCLWLDGLPPLIPTEIVEGRAARVHHEGPGKSRWKNRSRTLPGIAAAMADQWGVTYES